MDNSKNEGLQIARAVAALSVAYFHSYIALRGFPDDAQMPIAALKNWGYLGVDLFFAVSGYVICIVVSKPGFSTGSFVVKRLFRLYPLYLIALCLFALMIWRGYEAPVTRGHFLYSATLLPQSEPPAYELSWTLEREVVFYALAALIVPLAGIIGLAGALALLAFGGWYFVNPWTFHLVATTQADFLAGVLVFLSYRLLSRLGAIVPLTVGCAMLWITRSHSFAFDIPIIMGLILAGMANLNLPWERWPFRWLVAAGNASYSIYLLHYFTFYFATLASLYVLTHFPNLRRDWMCEPWRFAALALCCILSHFTWSWIERPMIRLGNRLQAKNAVIVAEVGV